MRRPPRKRLHQILAERIRRVFRKPDPEPDDPYALVGAPKNPRPPLKNLAAKAEPER